MPSLFGLGFDPVSFFLKVFVKIFLMNFNFKERFRKLGVGVKFEF